MPISLKIANIDRHLRSSSFHRKTKNNNNKILTTIRKVKVKNDKQRPIINKIEREKKSVIKTHTLYAC